MALAREGRVPAARIDDAVTRILRVKSAAGLLKPNPETWRPWLLWRAASAASPTATWRDAPCGKVWFLLKNENRVLPLSKGARIVVSGSGADDTGVQCGGWTITFQGKSGNIVPGATSIGSAMRNLGANVTLGAPSPEGDVNVVIAAEQPYAEFLGDARDLNLNAADAATINQAKQTG